MIYKILFNTLLGVVLILVWSRFVDINQIINVLKQVDLVYVGIAVLFIVLSTILRSFRLQILLKKKLSLTQLVSLNFLSQTMSFLIPVRAGEITKSVYLSGHLNNSLAKVVVWIFIDRFLDFWAILFTTVLLLIFLPVNLPQSSLYLAGLALLGFSFGGCLAVASQKQALKLASLFPMRTFTTSIIDGFSLLRMSLPDWIMVILATFASVISDSLIWYFGLLALGTKVGFLKVILGTCISAFTFLVPAAPGYVGSAEASGLLVFSGILGLPSLTASSTTVLLHLLNAVVLPVGGLIGLYVLDFDLNIVWRKLRKKD